MTDGRGGKRSKDDPRLISLEVLLKWEKEGVNSDALLTQVLEVYAYLGRENIRFIKRLTEGVIENAILLDYLIDTKSRIKVNKLKPVVRTLLRQGMYQLYFMDAVPSHAAINETVRLAGLKHLGALKGYINGVLRSADRDRTALDSIEDISVRFSCPEWITKLIKRDYGEEAAAQILKSFIGSEKLYIRVNSLKTGREELKIRLKGRGLTVKEVQDNEEALEISGVDMLSNLPEFKEGCFTVQDISSMSIGRLIDRYKDLSSDKEIQVLDLCAAPGGKCCHAAQLLKGLGDVEARDVSERKLSLIRENASRLGLENILISLKDATVTDEDSVEKFDFVIADLPCSGLGVIGRKNEIKYRLREGDIEALAALQRRILDSSRDYARKGGKLIYSVCTITKEETSMQKEYIEGLGYEFMEEKLFLPHQTDSDGFYYAVFKRL